MNVIDGLTYSQWQKRNTDTFCKLSKSQQQKVRSEGYFNVGWDRVKKSWAILIQHPKVLSLFDLQLKNGNLHDAIHQSILQAENAQMIAKKGRSRLNKKLAKLNEISALALDKYQLL